MNYIKRSWQVYKEDGIAILLQKIKKKLRTRFARPSIVSGQPEATIQLLDCVERVPVHPYTNPEVATVRLKVESRSSFHIPFAKEEQLDFDNCKDRVAVFAHIFYPELADKMLGYLQNLPIGTDIYISTDSKLKKRAIQETFIVYEKGQVIIRVGENRGRDVAPFLVLFKDVFFKYKYFLHIHSKKSPHSSSLDGWGEYCYKSLLGSEAIVKSNLTLLARQSVGLVMPAHYSEVEKQICWGYDFEKCQSLIRRMGEDISEDSLLEFPSGTMFWGRTEALRTLFNLDLQFSDFEEEAGQIDGTLAHAVERSLCYVCEINGFRWTRISLGTVDDRQVIRYMSSSFNRLLEKTYCPLFNTYVYRENLLDKLYPEQCRLNTFPCDSNDKLRFNLLIPTLNQDQIFGGISTALKVFNNLKDVGKDRADFRIIVTDSHLNLNARELYRDIFRKYPTICDDLEHLQVIEVPDRQSAKLYVRHNDVFIATAWWTATLSKKIIKDINRYFGNANQLVYLIQDYESHFYPWSSKWGLCDTTYQDKDIIAVINSAELAQFMEERFNFRRTYVLPYELNSSLRLRLNRTVAKERILIFYGRPQVDRNCFELIVDGIALWQLKNPVLSKSWKILSLGATYSPEICSNVKNLKIMGKMSLEEYADILNKSAVGISLMVSPHPSYPPLEMAEFGCLTISNTYDNKNLIHRSPNILNIRDFSPESVAAAIEEAICLFNKNESKPQSTNFLESSVDVYSADKLISNFLLH